MKRILLFPVIFAYAFIQGCGRSAKTTKDNPVQNESMKSAKAFFEKDERRVLTFMGFSGKGYQDEEGMLAAARGILEKEDPKQVLVNIGVTPDGIGAVYELAKSMGFTTTGIVSSQAKEYGAEPSAFVDHPFFITDSKWGGFLEDGVTLSPTSELMVAVSDTIIAIGGGAVARDEISAAQKSGISVQFFAADMNHEKAGKKGITTFGGDAASLFPTP